MLNFAFLSGDYIGVSGRKVSVLSASSVPSILTKALASCASDVVRYVHEDSSYPSLVALGVVRYMRKVNKHLETLDHPPRSQEP